MPRIAGRLYLRKPIRPPKKAKPREGCYKNTCPGDLNSSWPFGKPTRHHDCKLELRATMAEGQQPFPYHTEGLDALGYTLSDTRMSTYLKVGGRDRERALGLYLFNARLSKSMRFPLEIAEVTVRNRINYALVDRWGREWPRHPDFRTTAAEKSTRAIDDVYNSLGAGIRAADVVGGLSFGFWAAILRNRFVETLWRTRLERFFPNLPDLPFEKQIDVLVEKMDVARAVRNRIGHLEPIFKADPSSTHSEIIKLIGFACKPTAGWARHHSTFQRVLREGPGGSVQAGPVYGRAKRKPPVVPAETGVADAMHQLSAGADGYLIVIDNGAWQVVDHDVIGRWVSGHATEGIVAITDWTLAEVVAGRPALPLVPRSAGVADLLAALGFKSKPTGRYAVVTETGKAGEQPLGIADLHEFVG